MLWWVSTYWLILYCTVSQTLVSAVLATSQYSVRPESLPHYTQISQHSAATATFQKWTTTEKSGQPQVGQFSQDEEDHGQDQVWGEELGELWFLDEEWSVPSDIQATQSWEWLQEGENIQKFSFLVWKKQKLRLPTSEASLEQGDKHNQQTFYENIDFFLIK